MRFPCLEKQGKRIMKYIQVSHRFLPHANLANHAKTYIAIARMLPSGGQARVKRCACTITKTNLPDG
jgi:hypothetical protein